MMKANDPALDVAPDRRQQRLRAWLTNVKYYLGLIVLLALGALTSPHTSDGSNIFLSAANFSDVFRQVANVGVMSVGMTLVIITAGIDLSVGSVMGFGSVLTAILLTTPGSNAASWTALALDALSLFVIVFAAGGLVARRMTRGRTSRGAVALEAAGEAGAGGREAAGDASAGAREAAGEAVVSAREAASEARVSARDTTRAPAAQAVSAASAAAAAARTGSSAARTIGAREPGRVGTRAGIAVVVAVALCVSAWHQLPAKVSLLTVLWMVPLAGLAIGALNGWIITRGRMQPFIVTLAAMVGVMGVARLVAGQDTAVYSIYSGSNATTDIEYLRALLFGVVPVPALFFIVIALIADFVLNRTVFGKYLYAIGGNEKCARISGLKVDRHKIAAYAISGMLAALVGVLYAAQYRQGKADAGVGWELDAIAAVVIGGTSLMGGVGRIAGTVAGVLIFGFLGNILLLNNIDSNTQLVLKGLIIVIAVFLQQTRMNPQTMLARLRGRRVTLQAPRTPSGPAE
ncbi:MAG TPA: ABC transporter permease [Paraburkholderia sp.]|jgi:ribose/xylose/arabinose/galactoside ABC-type transport system permease subunit|nr:ABC transporter permease [Paraburkholderia sp.]